jgi:ribose transport system ATP-binding protein
LNGSEYLLQLRDICKSFGATRALHQVNLSVRPAEVHALIGENGAGKSTLMKVLSGAHQADSGQILLQGQPVSIPSPSAGRHMGVAMIYQELNLAPHLTVEENLTLGMEKTSLGFIRHDYEPIRKALELLSHPDLPLHVPVSELSIGLQQVVEIARALLCNARVIIMDEPTSSLTAADTRALFQAIRRLKESGISVIYISHFLEEVTEIADSYTVLRDGETVGSGMIADVTIDRIIELMVGRKLTEMFPRSEHTIGEPLMRVEGLEGSPIPRGVTFELRRGEILGIAGLVGSGRSETIRSLFGLDRSEAGQVTLSGQSVALRGMKPRQALGLRMDLLSENRKEEGLATGLSIAANTTLSSLSKFAGLGGWGLLSLGRERESVKKWIGEMNIRCQGPDQPVGGLSGGNQQKVALARILEQGGEVVLLDEPTRGVDVGSKVEIYRLVNRLAAEGKGIVFVSSYLPELLGVCDTLAVMHRGEMSPVRPIAEWTEQEIMRVATSGN